MKKYNGKTARLKGNKQSMIKNTIIMLSSKNLNIKRFFVDCQDIDFQNTMYITEIDQILKISDKLYQLESCCSSSKIKITENDIFIDTKNILDIFMRHSTNHNKKYLKHCDITIYNFDCSIKYIASKKNNFLIEICEKQLNVKYEVTIKGKNNYSHDSSKKFPVNILDNEIPRCVSPDWFLLENEYINFFGENFYEKKDHTKNRQNNLNEIKNQIETM